MNTKPMDKERKKILDKIIAESFDKNALVYDRLSEI